ncbi:MAG TPA: hypothetical protein VHC46_10290, partial [Thermodesulfobacteriota bacterium]|nr:hypothetical protein [Thermodesulfobacteriota bacterium]
DGLYGRDDTDMMSCISKSIKRLKLQKAAIISLVLSLLLVTGVSADPIKKNEVEDLNIVISQIVGGSPDVLLITDLSGSMIRAFGGSQIGNWDMTNDDGALDICEQLHCGGSCDDLVERSLAAHCAENITNSSVCGAKYCTGGLGTCDTQEQFNNFMACIQSKGVLTQAQINTILDKWCGNNNGTYNAATDICGNNDGTTPDGSAEFEGAAAALDAEANLTECSAANCRDFTGSGYTRNDYACDRSGEYTNFRNCMLNSQAIDINKAENCTGGTANPPYCSGKPTYGSTRLDGLLGVLFDFLDADDSLDAAKCDDPSHFYDGTSNSISCQNFMFTPYRNVRKLVREEGTNSEKLLPITGATDTPLKNQLTANDWDSLGMQIRPMTYSGQGTWNTCTSSSTFRVGANGFVSGSDTDLRDIWGFFRTQQGNGGTPLAWVLGFDDRLASQGGNVVDTDAIAAFNNELKTDSAVKCRPEFVIIITDGEDTCAGDPNGQSGQTSGSLTTNANRRSSIQAVSNLRTYYARNAVQNQSSGSVKKEILVFVIGLGITDPEAKRTLNAMALAGGTHTKGVIDHIAPNGDEVPGSVNMDNPDIFPQDAAFDVFKNLAKAKDIDTNPASAQLQGCKNTTANRSENNQCQFQNVNIFDNNFFNTGAPFNGTDKQLKDFAFFANSPQELAQALHDIAGTINVFSTSGVSPTAPQSSTAVALRDRIFMSILTPITTERLWQGRLALYGFVNDPDHEGNKEVIRRPP